MPMRMKAPPTTEAVKVGILQQVEVEDGVRVSRACQA